jgi:hypothetical protein
VLIDSVHDFYMVDITQWHNGHARTAGWASGRPLGCGVRRGALSRSWDSTNQIHPVSPGIDPPRFARVPRNCLRLFPEHGERREHVGDTRRRRHLPRPLRSPDRASRCQPRSSTGVPVVRQQPLAGCTAAERRAKPDKLRQPGQGRGRRTRRPGNPALRTFFPTAFLWQAGVEESEVRMYFCVPSASQWGASRRAG